jgi:hypothetical protein
MADFSADIPAVCVRWKLKQAAYIQSDVRIGRGSLRIACLPAHSYCAGGAVQSLGCGPDTHTDDDDLRVALAIRSGCMCTTPWLVCSVDETEKERPGGVVFFVLHARKDEIKIAWSDVYARARRHLRRVWRSEQPIQPLSICATCIVAAGAALIMSFDRRRRCNLNPCHFMQFQMYLCFLMGHIALNAGAIIKKLLGFL